MSVRERDIRNGYTIPPRITPSNVLDTIWRVGWIRGVLRGPRLTLANLVGAPGAPKTDIVTLGGVAHRQFDASVDWDAPWLTVGRLTLPVQDVSSDSGRRVTELIEKMSFDPWHALVELRPLGNMMRARNPAYRLSTQERKAAPEPDE